MIIAAANTTATGYAVTLEKLGPTHFRVTYGADVTTKRSADAALDQFKACVLHGLEAEGHGSSADTIYRFEYSGGSVAYFHTCIEREDGRREALNVWPVDVVTAANGRAYVFFDEPADCAEIAAAYWLEDQTDRWAMGDDDDNCIPLIALLPLIGKGVRA